MGRTKARRFPFGLVFLVVCATLFGFSKVFVVSSEAPHPSSDALMPSVDAREGTALRRRGQEQDYDQCAHLIDEEELATINRKIHKHKVVLFGIENVRCTIAAQKRLRTNHVCYHFHKFEQGPVWDYMKCKHPDATTNGVMMHSFVYMGGQYVGNGFALHPQELDAPGLELKLQDIGADRSCVPDCAKESGLAQSTIDELQRAVSTQPVVMYGWSQCPCTNIARERFLNLGACYVENVWADFGSKTMSYLQCEYGSEHHSFIWFGGEFYGDGFALEERKLGSTELRGLLDGAHTQYNCQKEGDTSLTGEDLLPCTQEGDGATTGWTRTGSCVWNPTDSGYHQVCVTMSNTFLRQSATIDGNDLSSVVQEEGHWCICAWAWAGAVQRDPENYEGIKLDCSRTNSVLRRVYQHFIDEGRDLQAPSGVFYKAKAALDAVNAVCPPSGGDASRSAQLGFV